MKLGALQDESWIKSVLDELKRIHYTKKGFESDNASVCSKEIFIDYRMTSFIFLSGLHLANISLR